MRLLVLSLAITAVAACHGGEAPPDADEALACQTSGRGDSYVVGLEHPGRTGALDFKLMSANPAPPGRFLNTWTIQINAMASGVVGAPATGASMIVTPYMPDHQHGAGAYVVHVTETSPGQYELSEINLSMPGYWEVTIDAQAGAAHDTVVYKFCIQA
jgi:hypothetical protein